jgi:hypothetical protein
MWIAWNWADSGSPVFQASTTQLPTTTLQSFQMNLEIGASNEMFGKGKPPFPS